MTGVISRDISHSLLPVFFGTYASRAQPKRRVLVGDQDKRVGKDPVVPADDALHEIEQPSGIVLGEQDGEPGDNHLQADYVSGLAVQPFQGGFVSRDQRDHDIAVVRLGRFVQQDHIAVADVVVDHGVAAHFQGEGVAAAGEIGEVQGFALLDGLHRRARGDAAHQRNLHRRRPRPPLLLQVLRRLTEDASATPAKTEPALRHSTRSL